MSPMNPQAPLLDFQHVSVMRGSQIVLHDLTLQIKRGEHVAILGPNGCGKSTFIKTITRELYPLVKEGSSVTLLGEKVWNDNKGTGGRNYEIRKPVDNLIS